MLLTVLSSVSEHCATGVAPSEARLRHDDEACDPAACTPPPRPEQLDPEGLAQKGRPHARTPRRAKRRKVCKFGFSQQRHALIQPSLRTLALPLLALEVAPLFLRERRLLGSGGGSGGSSSERPRRRHDAPPSPEEQLQLWSTGDARLDPRRALRTPLAVRPEVLDRRPLHLPHMPRR